MWKLVNLVVLCLALPAFGELEPRIVGGSDAPEGKYPYQVSLRVNGNHICGGSVINKRYVLTAAHCLVVIAPGQEDTLKVHVGTNQRLSVGTKYDVEEIIPHALFNKAKPRYSYDIGLLRVAKDIEFNDLVQPIPLDDTNFSKEGDTAVLTGWGRIKAWGALPENLQEIDLRISSHRRCRIVFRFVGDGQICTLTKRGEGACNGDSGGPLVVNGVQVGVVSLGLPCARGVPDVFTRVASYTGWINEHMH